MTITESDIVLDDWKQTKENIRHFGNMLTQLRLQGIPIGTAIQAAGLITAPTTADIRFPIAGLEISVASIILFAGSLYLVPIFALDVFHFSLLLSAVFHAIEIEEKAVFKGNLGLTHALTSPKATFIHIFFAFFTYLVVILFGFVMAFLLNSPPPKVLWGVLPLR